MATLPLPGSKPIPSFDPDEVGYIKPAPGFVPHKPQDCTEDHCSCHLPAFRQFPGMGLTGQEAFVLAWHLFALRDDDYLDFPTIARKLGVTPERVKQIYGRAAAKIRAHARVHYPVKPGTPEAEEQARAVEKYHAEHPESDR